MTDPTLDTHPQRRKERADAASDAPADVRVGRLDSGHSLRVELGRLYRSSRKRAGAYPNPQDAARLAFILHKIAESLLAKELADRISALEGRIAGTALGAEAAASPDALTPATRTVGDWPQ